MMVRVHYRLLAYLVLGAALSGAKQASAFFPRQATATFKAFGSTSHEEITKLAIDQVLGEAGITKKAKATRDAIAEIVAENAHVDDFQRFSEFHCDGESLPEAQQRIVSLLDLVRQRLSTRDGRGARRALGAALHTTQDFYSHSNWIELGNTSPNAALTHAAPVVDRADSSVAVCGSCPPATCLCQNKVDLVGATLTSGYYPDQTRIQPNEGKCGHGGPDLKHLGLRPLDGINKDTNDCDWSPHAPLHGAAGLRAIDATVEILRELKQQLPVDQFRLLLGLGPVVIFGIDTSRDFQLLTGPGARDFIRYIINDQIMTGQEPSKYVLVTFDDSGSQNVLTTTDPNEVLQAGAAIAASTDSDSCVETYSLSAAMAGIQAAGGGAELFLWTNTAPGDASLVDGVAGLAAEKQVRIWSFLWDQSGIFVCKDPPSNAVFQTLTASTGGQAFYPTMDDAMSAAALVLAALAIDAGTVTSGGGPFGGGAKASALVPIDTSIDSVTLTALGATTLTVLRPNGSTVMAGDPGVTLNTAGTRKTATIQSPAAGIWTLNLTGTGKYQFQAVANSNLTLDRVRFVEDSGDPGHPGRSTLPGAPVADQMGTIDLLLSRPLQNPVVELHDVAGAVLRSSAATTNMNASQMELSATMQIPNVSFTVHVIGTDMAANRVERAAPEVIVPRTVRVSPPLLAEDLPMGNPTAITFVVTNVGAPKLFLLQPSDDLGSVISIETDSFQLLQGESRQVTLTVTAPATARIGMNDAIRLSVTGGLPETVNSGSVQMTVGQPMKSDGGCGCDLERAGNTRPSAIALLTCAIIAWRLRRRSC